MSLNSPSRCIVLRRTARSPARAPCTHGRRSSYRNFRLKAGLRALGGELCRSPGIVLGIAACLMAAVAVAAQDRPGEVLRVASGFDKQAFSYRIELESEHDSFRVYRLTYPSRVPSPVAQNNTIPAELYLPKGIRRGSPPRPAVICLHSWAAVSSWPGCNARPWPPGHPGDLVQTAVLCGAGHTRWHSGPGCRPAALCQGPGQESRTCAARSTCSPRSPKSIRGRSA